MDEEEILPFEEFEEEILRARTGKTTLTKAAHMGSADETTNGAKVNETQDADTRENGKHTKESADDTTEVEEKSSVDDAKKNQDKEAKQSGAVTGSSVVSLSHIIAEPEPKPRSAAALKPAAPAGVCYDFQKGVCLRGETCRWSHTAPKPISERSFNSAFTVPVKAPELSEEEKAKRSRRVEKFGVSQLVAEAPVSAVVTEEVLQNRIKRFGEVVPDVSPASIDPDLLAKAQANPVDLTAEQRPSALHICGTWLAKKNSKQILTFFASYEPSHVEWIDLYSCNVAFNDASNSRRALLACSHPPDLSTALTPEQQTQATSLGLSDSSLSSWVWRLAFASRSSAVLLMRLATTKDVKIHPAERKGFSEYFSQRLAPQFPSDVPKLVKVAVPADSLVDDADLKETIEARETVDDKGRTIRGRGLKVSGKTRGLGALPLEREAPVTPTKHVIKKEPEDDIVKSESDRKQKIVQLKSDSTKRKRAESADKKSTDGEKTVSKKRLLVTKRGDIQALQSSDNGVQRSQNAALDRSISPKSRGKKPKKIITSRWLQNSPSPNRERGRSLPSAQVARGKLRMDASRSRSFSPVAISRKKNTARARAQRSPSRSLSPPENNRKNITTSRKKKKVSPSRSFSPPPAHSRAKPQRSVSRSLSRSPLRRTRSRSYSRDTQSKPHASKLVVRKKVAMNSPKGKSTLPPKRVDQNAKQSKTSKTMLAKSKQTRKPLSKSFSKSVSRSPSQPVSRSRSPQSEPRSGASRSHSKSLSSRSASRRSKSRSQSSRSRSVHPPNSKSGRFRPR